MPKLNSYRENPRWQNVPVTDGAPFSHTRRQILLLSRGELGTFAHFFIFINADFCSMVIARGKSFIGIWKWTIEDHFEHWKFFSKPIRSLDNSVIINIDTVRECAPMGWAHSRMRWGRFVQRRDTFGKAAKMLRNVLSEEVTNKYFTCLKCRTISESALAAT